LKVAETNNVQALIQYVVKDLGVIHENIKAAAEVCKADEIRKQQEQIKQLQATIASLKGSQ